MGGGQPATLQLLPIELKVGDRIADATGLWEVIDRPVATPNEKTVHVRVRRIGQPAVPAFRAACHARVAALALDRLDRPGQRQVHSSERPMRYNPEPALSGT